jgi:hypothetical protein
VNTYKIYFLSLVVMFFGSTLLADIVERKNITSVKEFIGNRHEDLCVIFDLDNTSIRPDTEKDRGSDQWFWAMVKHLVSKGNAELEAIKKILPSLFEIQKNAKVVPVEAEIVPLIQELQNKKIHVMALTARSPELEDCTIKQLSSVNIDFFKTSLVHVPTFTFDGPLNQNHYKHGILFCGNNSKGPALLDLFKRTKYMPAKVIFVDDKRKYLECVEKEFNQHGIKDVTGIRYGYLDERVANFKLDPAEPLLIQKNMKWSLSVVKRGVGS